MTLLFSHAFKQHTISLQFFSNTKNKNLTAKKFQMGRLSLLGLVSPSVHSNTHLINRKQSIRWLFFFYCSQYRRHLLSSGTVKPGIDNDDLLRRVSSFRSQGNVRSKNSQWLTCDLLWFWFMCLFLVQSALHSCSFVLGKPVDYALARVRFGNRYIHATGFFFFFSSEFRLLLWIIGSFNWLIGIGFYWVLLCL